MGKLPDTTDLLHRRSDVVGGDVVIDDFASGLITLGERDEALGEVWHIPAAPTQTTRELADSQLFGHRRGSFTGALSDQPGVLRTAVGGTLFLDEIGDLPIDIQPKLLRFLETKSIERVGGSKPIELDVRLVAATNRNLEQMVH